MDGPTMQSALQYPFSPFSNYFLSFTIGDSKPNHLTDSFWLRTDHQWLFLPRSSFAKARQRRHAIGGPNNFLWTALFISNM